MQAIPGLLPAMRNFGCRAMAIESTYPRGNEQRGQAQSGKLHVNALGQLAHSNGPLESPILGNVKMQAVIGSNDRRCMKPSRKDHHVSSQGRSENSLKMMLGVTLFLRCQS